jgi:peptide/nickel transport system permease protein
MTLMPGDPVELMAMSNPKIRPEDVERLKKLYGLDLPVYTRYFNWLGEFVQGNFGYSRTYRVPVMEIMGERLLNTFYLSFSALILSLLIAVPAGIIAALRNGTKFDYSLNLIAFMGQSLPPFWIGIMFIMIFAVGLGLLPAGGTYSIGTDLQGFAYIADRAKYLLLPIGVFTVSQVALYLRFTRGSMLDVLRQDYIRTARAKGLSRKRVIMVHGFRNALIPLVTMLALQLATIFDGAIISEQVFAYQGVGKLVLDSVMSNDFNVAMVSFTISVGLVLFMNLIADISYAFIDPRISYK